MCSSSTGTKYARMSILSDTWFSHRFGNLNVRLVFLKDGSVMMSNVSGSDAGLSSPYQARRPPSLDFSRRMRIVADRRSMHGLFPGSYAGRWCSVRGMS